MIEVNETWLKQIAQLADKVSKQIDALEPSETTAINKTSINLLIGYASSAGNLIKYRRIAERDQ
jgi:hypothetical protein